MFIQTEPVDQENTLKFLPGRDVLGQSGESGESGQSGESGESGEVAFADAGAAERSPLAARLFQLDAVSAVTLGSDFIRVTKTADVDWQLIKPAVFGIIMEHFLAGKVTLMEETRDEIGDESGTVAEILELIESRVRPGIVEQGGDILFRDFTDGVVRLELLDKGLSGPSFSLQIRVENTLRHYVSEVTSVVFTRAASESGDLDLNDPETAAVYKLLEENVNPSVAAHGGHIALLDVADHIAFIRLEGGCQRCGMAHVT
ncbi:MAG: NifU family protein, partial [Proteobacteria bacterium]|nr:NifU family protein [Pseudomonadota bacterium]